MSVPVDEDSNGREGEEGQEEEGDRMGFSRRVARSPVWCFR